jgi:hypothetical protein
VSLHGAGEGQRDSHGTVAREEEVTKLSAQVREGGRERGHDLVGQLGLLGRSKPKGRMAVGLFGPKGRMAVGLFGPKVEGKNHFRIKIGF